MPGTTVAMSDCAKSGLDRQLVAFIGRHRKHHAAQPGNLQQEVPALRVGHVAHGDQVGNDGGEIERRAHHQEALRPGEAIELDAERSPHVAAGAVGADQPAAGPRLRCRPLRSIAISTPDACWVTCRTWAVELQLETRFAAQLLVKNAGELGLLACTR